MKTIKKICILSGVLILFVFLAPNAGGILNIGNIFGMVVGAVILAIGLELEKILVFVKRACRKTSFRVFLRVFLSAFAVGVLCFCVTLGSIVCASFTNAAHQKTVIVLGCSVVGEEPSLMLAARVDAAYAYLKQEPDSVAILSGGQGKAERISEAQCMYKLLTDKGIEGSRLYLEAESRDTTENIRNSARIIEENGFSKEVAVVSSDFHLKRARMICADYGLTAYGVSARSGFFATPTFYVREVFGVVKQFLFS